MALLAVITAFMEDMTSVTQEQIDQIGKTLLKKKDFKSPAVIVRDLTKDEVSAFTVVGLIQEKIEKLEQDHKKSKIDGTHTMESCELYATEVEKLNRRRDLFSKIFWESVRIKVLLALPRPLHGRGFFILLPF